MMNRQVLLSTRYFTKVLECPWDNTHPIVVKFYRNFQKECAKRGIPMYAFEFYRDKARQTLLRQRGVSKAGPGQSPHNWGLAVDFIHYERLWNLTNKEWEVIGAIGKEVARKMNLKVRWGGDWDSDGIPVYRDKTEHFWDPAHWEIENWKEYRTQIREVRALAAESGTPLEEGSAGWFDMIERRIKDARKKS